MSRLHGLPARLASALQTAGLAGLLGLAGLGAGCKAGLGDRCQVLTDCQDNLLCNQATNTCQLMTGGQIDATVPDAPASSADAAVDAPAVDAPAVDAPAVDAAIDA